LNKFEEERLTMSKEEEANFFPFYEKVKMAFEKLLGDIVPGFRP
jgi:hypothetical protein